MSNLSPERKTIGIGPPGEWGSAFAKVVAENGHEVRLLMRTPQDVGEFQRTHQTKRLKGVDLPDNVKAYSDREEFARGLDALALAPPSRFFRPYYREITPYLDPQIDIISLTKGLEQGTNLRMSAILLEEDPTRIDNIAVLSGPNLAKEVAQSEVIAGTVVAAYTLDTATRIQDWLNSGRFRVYTSEDVEGVEYYAVLKNIMALGAGIADELKVAQISKALYFTRALEEMYRFGMDLGAQEATFRSLAAVGDVALSFYGGATRNYRAGVKKAQGQSTEEILQGELAEGIYALKSAVDLTRQHEIDAPLTIALYGVFFEGLDIHEGISQLMGRQPKKEHEGVMDLGRQAGRLVMKWLHRLGINPPRNHF